MAQETTSYDAVLKEVYEGGIREMIPTKTRVLTIFEEGDNSAWMGREVVYPSRIGRNQGIGWASEMGALPEADKQKYVDTRIPVRFLYGRITLSAQVMKASENSRGAFAPAFRQEMEGIILDLQNERGRAIFGTGLGIYAFINGAANSATQNIDSPGGWAGSINGARFIAPGMTVGLIKPANGQLRANSVRRVVNDPTLGDRIILDSAVNASDNDYIVRVQHPAVTDVSDTSYQKEIMGLGGLVDDGGYVLTLHNVNRYTYPLFQSTVIPNVGAWSSDVIQRGSDVADQRGGGEITDLVMHHSLRRVYIQSMEPYRRYVSGDLMTPDQGTQAMRQRQLGFGGIPIIEDKYCPYNITFGLDRSGFKRYSLEQGAWIQEDGAILARVGTGRGAIDAFEATYRIWDNFHCDYPHRCFRLDGFTGAVIVPIQLP